ncbi:MAG: hypothetical protein ACT4P4_02455 [Betaproteobacteria bacterium]
MLVDDAPVRALCGSEARYRLVRALYEAPHTAFHLRGLAAAARVDPGQVARLLPQLVAAGLCEALSDAPFRKYRAAAGHPLTDALKKVFADDAGDAEVVDLSDAPVLRSLLWSGRERSEIPAREAFRHYENHWRDAQGAGMGRKEKQLVERLARRYGRGLING